MEIPQCPPTTDRCGEAETHTKSARNANKIQGVTSQEVSKRWEESKVSVPKLMLRRGLKETIAVVIYRGCDEVLLMSSRLAAVSRF